ncbi:HD domain-containing protein [Allobaculum sp. Allo2]|uniref:HD domain-containing protein n=1 Tax=Allobaculum sp. Allo2 TaxID=2853432 RepID=UPI001F607F7A|nr:HD domain-containing protein [Allobaculum sp. Allo2]UNT93618.1 HD domain-containing protein [Allobaculum sp. Allo2]
MYEICRRILNEVPGVTDTLDEFEQTAALCAALLHDLGHGPLSHSYEAISHIHHEAVTCRLITNPEGEVYKILTGENPKLPAMVAAILEHRSGCALLEDLISSQLDCDRMDYLLRDAYETGTSYGRFDLERILRTLRVKDGRLCIKKAASIRSKTTSWAAIRCTGRCISIPMRLATICSFRLSLGAMPDCVRKTLKNTDRKRSSLYLISPLIRSAFWSWTITF